MKEIADLIAYLKEIDKLQRPLKKEQREKLREIIRVILSLLVALKRDSNLGRQFINFNGQDFDIPTKK